MSSTGRRRAVWRAALPAAVLAIAALAFAGCGGDDGPSGATTGADTTTVMIKTFIFDPDPLRVPAGTAIRFENLDGTTHTVTAGPRDEPTGEFDASLDAGGTTEITLERPGTYPYHCTLHPGGGMEGEIVVE